MKEEVLEKIREEAYQKYIELKEYNRRVFDDKELNNNQKLNKYKNINIEDIVYSIYEKYSSVMNESETYGIYVYRGTYRNIKPNDDNLNVIVSRNSKDAEYSIYSNLEKYNLVFVDIKDREEFEKNHKVIFDVNYYDARRSFAIEYVNGSQYNAVKNILSRSKK